MDAETQGEIYKQLSPNGYPAYPREVSAMEKHLTVIAIIHIAFGLLLLFVGIGLFVVISGGGLISGEPQAIFATSVVGSALGLFFTLLAIPGIIGGIGLLRMLSWSRILMLIIAFLELIVIPIGTVIGVYTIWALLNDEAIALFRD